jgi:UPF0755 protein
MRKRTARTIIFIVTLLIFFGGIGAAGYAWLTRPSGASSGGLTIAAPSNVEDFFVSFYLDFRRSELTTPAGDDPTAVVFTIEPGESVGQIAARLQSEGLVRDAQLFRLYLRYSKLDSGVEAGQFTLKRTMTIPQLAQALQSGRRDELTLTIPEGRRLEEVALLVAQQTPISATAFLSLTRDAKSWTAQFPFLAELPADASLEGYLFPDTYRLPEDVTASDLIARMLANLDHRVKARLAKAHIVSGCDAGFHCRTGGSRRKRAPSHRQRVSEPPDGWNGVGRRPDGSVRDGFCQGTSPLVAAIDTRRLSQRQVAI